MEVAAACIRAIQNAVAIADLRRSGGCGHAANLPDCVVSGNTTVDCFTSPPAGVHDTACRFRSQRRRRVVRHVPGLPRSSAAFAPAAREINMEDATTELDSVVSWPFSGPAVDDVPIALDAKRPSSRLWQKLFYVSGKAAFLCGNEIPTME